MSRKRVVADEYESDEGFVEDAPKSKKAKTGAKAPLSYDMKEDENGPYWELSGKRRVQISEFKGTTMINVREYYEKDGKMLPGKKGISLSLDQYTAFVELLPQFETVLKSKGADVPRPQYDTTASKKSIKQEEDEKEAAEDEVDVKPPKETSKSKSKLEKFRMKGNHEATSDEDNA